MSGKRNRSNPERAESNEDDKFENSETKILIAKLAKLKTELSQHEFNNLKALKKEIQRLNQAKGNLKDKHSRQTRLTKLNRNLALLTYVFIRL